MCCLCYLQGTLQPPSLPHTWFHHKRSQCEGNSLWKQTEHTQIWIRTKDWKHNWRSYFHISNYYFLSNLFFFTNDLLLGEEKTLKYLDYLIMYEQKLWASSHGCAGDFHVFKTSDTILIQVTGTTEIRIMLSVTEQNNIWVWIENEHICGLCVCILNPFQDIR